MKSKLAFLISSERKCLACIAVLSLLIVFSACNFAAPDETKTSNLDQTQVALSVEQTLAAKEGPNATIAAQQATIQAQAALATAQAQQPPAQPPQQPTQEAVQPAPLQPQQPPQQPTQEVVVQPQQPPAGNIQEQMKNAQILLYEDMVSDPSEYRYVKRTLDAMGLRYKDDGNAQGWLKSDLLGNSPSGEPWDAFGCNRRIFRLYQKCVGQGHSSHPGIVDPGFGFTRQSLPNPDEMRRGGLPLFPQVV
jgi:hypothetical protein